MKLQKTFWALCALSLLAAAHTAQAQNCTVIVHADGFRNDKGDAGATLFKTPDGWPEDNDKAFKHGPFPIVNKKSTIKFEDVPAGTYAFAVIHDENMNHKMDRNMFGIPKEGFGFGGNPHVTFKTPTFNEAAVRVTCPVTEISVHMQYK